MNDSHNQQPHELPTHPAREVKDVNPLAVGFFASGIVLVLLIVLPFLNWTFWRFEDSSRQTDKPQMPRSEGATSNKPKLQARPAAEFAQFRLEEDKRLTSYRWIDRKKGVIQIPIDRAIEILAERGFPQTTTAFPTNDLQEGKP